MHPGVTVAPALVAAFLDPGRLRVLRPALRAGGLDINIAARKKHTAEQVVRKLAAADRKPRRDTYATWTAVAPDLVFTVLTYGSSPLYGAAVSAQFQLSRPAKLAELAEQQHRIEVARTALEHGRQCPASEPMKYSRFWSIIEGRLRGLSLEEGHARVHCGSTDTGHARLADRC